MNYVWYTCLNKWKQWPMDYTQRNENHHEYISKASGLSYKVAQVVSTMWYIGKTMLRNLHMKGIIFLTFSTRKQGFN